MKKAIGYVRVSTDTQADRGVSLAAQQERIGAMAIVQGVELVEIIVDSGESAKSLNRPGARRLLDMVNSKKVEVVIVAKLDRLTRSVRDLADLLDVFNRRGVALVSLGESLDTGSAAGRMVMNLLAVVSQWEREAIGERTRAALQHKKAKGERVGVLPFGYRLGPDGKHIAPDAAEQETLRRMLAMRAARQTFRRIADNLNADGHRTRNGGLWSPQGVHQIAKRAGTIRAINAA